MNLTERLNRDWNMGKAAYDAYNATPPVDTEAYAWEGLATRIQDAWIAAAHAGHREYVCDCVISTDANGDVVTYDRCGEHS